MDRAIVEKGRHAGEHFISLTIAIAFAYDATEHRLALAHRQHGI